MFIPSSGYKSTSLAKFINSFIELVLSSSFRYDPEEALCYFVKSDSSAVVCARVPHFLDLIRNIIVYLSNLFKFKICLILKRNDKWTCWTSRYLGRRTWADTVKLQKFLGDRVKKYVWNVYSGRNSCPGDTKWIYGKHDENLQENTELVKITALYAENVQWFWFLSVNTLIWWRIDCLGRLYFSCLTYIYMVYMKQWKFTVRFLGA